MEPLLAHDYRALLEIGVELSSSLSPERVLELALSRVENLCNADSSSIWELDKDKGELFFRVVRGESAEMIRDLRVKLGEGIVGSVARTGHSEMVRDVRLDDRWRRLGVDIDKGAALLSIPLLARGRVIGVLQLLRDEGKHPFDARDLHRMELFAGLVGPALENARLYAAQEQQYFEIVTALAGAIEKRDPYTGGHVWRVVHYSLVLGERLGMSATELKELWLAAALHDIGKIGVPDLILCKPGALSREEQEVIQRHPADGADIVAKVRGLRPLAKIIRAHHERLDGSGYPDGLGVDSIPLAARIIAVADSYDAMTTKRPYRDPLSPKQAAEVIVCAAGEQFCPRVVAAFDEARRTNDLTLDAGARVMWRLGGELAKTS